MLKIRRPLGRLIFNMGIAIPGKTIFLIETAPRCLSLIIYHYHYNEVIMSMMASQITGLTIVCSTVYSGADQRKHQSSASLAFVQGFHRWLVNSLHKWSVMQKMLPFDDVIMMKWASRPLYSCCKESVSHSILISSTLVSDSHLSPPGALQSRRASLQGT